MRRLVPIALALLAVTCSAGSAQVTDPRVLVLVPDAGAGGWVDPEEFTRAFGVELCGADECSRSE